MIRLIKGQKYTRIQTLLCKPFIVIAQTIKTLNMGMYI